jgi:hypothetical protein
MKSKSPIAMIALIATLSILLTAFVSAAALSLKSISVPDTVDHNAGSFPVVFELTNTGVADASVSFSDSAVTSGTGTVILSDVAIAEGSQDPVTITLTATVNFPAHQTGAIQGTIFAKPSLSGSAQDLAFSTNIQVASTIEIKETLPLTHIQNGKITIENTGNQILKDVTFSQSGNFNLAFTPASISNLNPGESQEVEVAGVNLDALNFGTNSVKVTARSGDVKSNDLTFSLDESFCKVGSVGNNLAIKDISIDNLGEGSDEEWNILDVIEVEVEVKNEGDERIRDIIVELALFDDSGEDVTSDLDFENSDEEEIKLGSLGDRDDDKVTFRFKVTADLDGSNYRLAIKAYSDDSDLGEELECTDTSGDLSDDFFERIDLERESDEEDFLRIDDVRINPEDVTCGDTVDVSFDIVNVGDENIEDRFKVMLDSTALGISLSQDIRKDIDEGDTERATFTFRVPPGLEDDNYLLRITSEHDYRSSSDSFQVQSAEEKSILLTVFGCSFVPTQLGSGSGSDSIASISATLDSDAQAGEPLIVRAVITNLKSEATHFIVSASGFESWAGLDAISNRLITLNPGESEEITLSFSVDSDVEGQQSFILEARAGDNLQTREVAVNIEGSESTTSTPEFNLGGNNLLWLIGVINVILIVLIIVVAVRISRR